MGQTVKVWKRSERMYVRPIQGNINFGPRGNKAVARFIRTILADVMDWRFVDGQLKLKQLNKGTVEIVNDGRPLSLSLSLSLR